MKLHFASLTLQNFKSFLGSHTFSLDKHGLNFLAGRNEMEPKLGSNGSGKTSVFDAFSWCAYGKTSGGLKNVDVRSWGVKERTHVRLAGEADDTPFSIERTANPNSLHLNGEECNQEAIDAFLCLNYETFNHTILLGQGQSLFFDLEPNAKMSLFSDVLNLSRWDKRADHASEQLRLLQTKSMKLGGELSAAKASYDFNVGVVEQLSGWVKGWEAENRKRLEDLSLELKAKEKELKKIDDLKSRADLDCEGANTELEALKTASRVLSDELQLVTEKTSKQDANLNALKREKAKATSYLEKLGEEDECPTCGQTIKGTDLEKHKNEFRNQVISINGLIKKLNANSFEAELQSVKEKIQKHREHEKSFSIKADDARSALNRLIPTHAYIEASIRTIKKQIAEGEEAENPHKDRLQEAKTQKTKLFQAIKEIESQAAVLDARIERTKYWVKGFKDIRLLIVDEVLQELELTTNSLLQEVGMDDWSVAYAVEKETKAGTIQRGLNVLITSPHNQDPVKWKSWSGGEGQRLRVIGALALSEVLLSHAGIQCNLEILDEPTSHLSKHGVDYVCDLLYQRASFLDKTIWLVDHMAIQSDKFESVVTIVKDKNGSSIME